MKATQPKNVRKQQLMNNHEPTTHNPQCNRWRTYTGRNGEGTDSQSVCEGKYIGYNHSSAMNTQDITPSEQEHKQEKGNNLSMWIGGRAYSQTNNLQEEGEPTNEPPHKDHESFYLSPHEENEPLMLERVQSWREWDHGWSGFPTSMRVILVECACGKGLVVLPHSTSQQ